MGRDILQALRDKNEKGMRDRVVSWGISADKVLGGVESSGLTLHVPTALLEKFMLAVQIKPSGDTNKSIGNTTTIVTDQQVTPTKEG